MILLVGRNKASRRKEGDMPNSSFENASVTGSVPMTAAESEDHQIDSPEVKLYEVSISAELQMNLTGTVNVYAVNVDEAIEKVQDLIDTEALDDDLTMEDYSGCTLPYGDVKYIDCVEFQIGNVELVEYPVDPADVLKGEVEELQRSISWDADALAKHKAFLESLLNEVDEPKAIRDVPSWLHCFHYPDGAGQFTKRAIYFNNAQTGEYTIPCVVCPNCLLAALTPDTVCAGIGPDPMPHIPTLEDRKVSR
jgi:hypothetical protein